VMLSHVAGAATGGAVYLWRVFGRIDLFRRPIAGHQ
jgi:hypothetical protein